MLQHLFKEAHRRTTRCGLCCWMGFTRTEVRTSTSSLLAVLSEKIGSKRNLATHSPCPHGEEVAQEHRAMWPAFLGLAF